MKEIVFLNGKFIPRAKACISILEPGFTFGLGLFETMRAVRGGIVYYREHINRIKSSSKALKIKFSYSEKKLKSAVFKLVDLNGHYDNYVKLALWKQASGTGVYITVNRYKARPKAKYEKGFSACIFSQRQNEHSILARHKTFNRIFYELALSEAKNRNYDEAIILNSQNYITEACRSNIFFVKNKRLFTPGLTCGCLNGITRQAVFDIAKIQSIPLFEGSFKSADLYKAEEAFLTNSLMGIMPLNSIEKKTIGLGKCGELTRFLREQYNFL